MFWISGFFGLGFLLLSIIFCRAMIEYSFFSRLNAKAIASITVGRATQDQGIEIERIVSAIHNVQLFLPNHTTRQPLGALVITVKESGSRYTYRLSKLKDTPGAVISDESGNPMLFVEEFLELH